MKIKHASETLGTQIEKFKKKIKKNEIQQLQMHESAKFTNTPNKMRKNKLKSELTRKCNQCKQQL